MYFLKLIQVILKLQATVNLREKTQTEFRVFYCSKIKPPKYFWRQKFETFE